MRIKHTDTEVYRVYYYKPMQGTFKDYRRWYYYQDYKTKDGAMSAIRRIHVKYGALGRIDWHSNMYSHDYITIYSDEGED